MAMNVGNTVYCRDRAAWHGWLAANHRREKQVWLVFYRKQAGKPTLSYAEAVEEALCFGWIDSIIKRMDDERYAQRYTPRGAKTRWSPTNIERASRMVREGRMTGAGLESFRGATPHLAPANREGLALPPSLLAILQKNRRAQDNFERLSLSQRRLYVGWVLDAKKDETRRRRLAEAIGRLEQGLRLGLK
jgi:uncharacterized protein YdeI (YjbR/CyaY-like superfamily)